MNLDPATGTGPKTSSPQRELWENPEHEIDSSPVYGAKDSRTSHQSLRNHNFTNLLTHIIFSTKDRNPIITPEINPRLAGCMNDIILKLNECPLTIHGTAESAAP